MSLINDALEKARSEADARAERERATGGPSADYRPPRAHLPRRTGWAPGLAIGLILGVVLVGAIGLGWWLGRSGEAPEPAAGTVAATSPAEPTTTEPSRLGAPTEAAGADERSSGEPVDEKPNDAPNPAESTTPTVTPEPSVEAESEPSAQPVTASVEPAEPAGAPEPDEPASTEPDIAEPATAEAPAPETSTTEISTTQPTAAELAATEPTSPRPTLIQPPDQVGHVADNVYVLEAQLGGLTLELDFIVWGATPFAQINGRQVEVDQAVDGGFLVDAIDRQQVTLKHADGRVVVLRIR
ncbi:MAG: hypothetical protein AAGE94_01725 [Acidobacteriota bacterium]